VNTKNLQVRARKGYYAAPIEASAATTR
jgi:hypothetical protein